MGRQRLGRLLRSLALLLLWMGLTLASAGSPALAGPVDWREVSASSDGRQWWDAGSLRLSRGGHLSVLSRFQPAPDGDTQPGPSDLYVMEIDCDQQLYRDTSINGIPRFQAEWQAPADEGLITAVIEASCAAGSPLLQAA